jgi:hypothetical protein
MAAGHATSSHGASGHGASSHATTDHEEIRRWAEERGGKPACVRGTGGKDDPGVIRLDFPTGPEPSLAEISWDEWFEKFDENQLALVFQESTAEGQPSRFNKLVSRQTVETDEKAPKKQPAKTRTAGGSGGRH